MPDEPDVTLDEVPVEEDRERRERELEVLRRSVIEDDAAVREAWVRKGLLYGVG